MHKKLKTTHTRALIHTGTRHSPTQKQTKTQIHASTRTRTQAQTQTHTNSRTQSTSDARVNQDTNKGEMYL